jgi:hypothetical protein
VSLRFLKLGFKHLKAVDAQVVSGLDPYVKYQYSKYWPLVEHGRMKAVYSTIQHRTLNPFWEDLPTLNFKTTLKEMLGNSVVVHCAHHGASQHTTVARANLLFRTLVDSGKTFKEKDTITFNGPLKQDGATIYGELVFSGLPHFAQVKPVNVAHKPIHTEEGLHDCVKLLPWVVDPDLPFLSTSDTPSNRVGGTGKVARHLDDAAQNASAPSARRQESPDDTDRGLRRTRSKSVGAFGAAFSEAMAAQKQAELAMVDDLITFGTPTPRKPTESRIPDENQDELLREVAEATGIAELMLGEANASAQEAREGRLDPVLQPEATPMFPDPFAPTHDDTGDVGATIGLDFFSSPAPADGAAASGQVEPKPQGDDFNPFL